MSENNEAHAFDFAFTHAEPVNALDDCLKAKRARRRGEDMRSAEDIIDNFRPHLYLMRDEDLDLLAAIAQRGGTLPYEPGGHFPLQLLFSYYVFAFENGGRQALVLPDELREIFLDVTGQEDFAGERAYHAELSRYAYALLDLYGYYEAETFALVWNRHHKGKITENAAFSFLEAWADFSDDAYVDNADYIVSDAMTNEDYDALWEEVHAMECYVPPKSVIREYFMRRSERGYHFPAEREMLVFLAGHIADDGERNDAQYDLRESCERMRGPAAVRAILKAYELPLDDAAFAALFERLYNQLRGETHMWELRGYTPNQYQSETGKSLKYVRVLED